MAPTPCPPIAPRAATGGRDELGPAAAVARGDGRRSGDVGRLAAVVVDRGRGSAGSECGHRAAGRRAGRGPGRAGRAVGAGCARCGARSGGCRRQSHRRSLPPRASPSPRRRHLLAGAPVPARPPGCRAPRRSAGRAAPVRIGRGRHVVGQAVAPRDVVTRQCLGAGCRGQMDPRRAEPLAARGRLRGAPCRRLGAASAVRRRGCARHGRPAGDSQCRGVPRGGRTSSGTDSACVA